MRGFGWIVLAAAVLLAGCGKKMEEAPSPAELSSGPEISPTAAPGVAFNYRYDFRLGADRIAGVQELHAQACEKLGVARCRITGMRYRLYDADQIEAKLELKLAPALARAFGKQGIAAVEKADGQVVDTEIGGTDVGTGIAAAQRDEASLAQQLAEAEKRLATPGLTDAQKQELIARLDSLRGQTRQSAAGQAEAEEALANTPMAFEYRSGGLIPGFDPWGPIVDALRQAASIVVGVIAFIIMAIAFIVPLGLLFALFRYLWPYLAAAFDWLGSRRDAGRPRVEDKPE